jgi:hypothetical protein
MVHTVWTFSFWQCWTAVDSCKLAKSKGLNWDPSWRLGVYRDCGVMIRIAGKNKFGVLMDIMGFMAGILGI